MKTNRGKWIWRGVVILGVAWVIALAWLTWRRKDKPIGEPAAERPVPVRVVKIEAGDIPRIIEVVGVVEPRTDILIAAEQPGVVTDVLADKGQRVTRGEILLKLDDRLARIAVEEARLQVEETERDLERRAALLASGAISLSDFQAVETRAGLVRAALQRAETLLSKRTLRSPSDGWIEHRYFEPGDYAREGDPAFRLLDLEEVKIRFDIPEREVPHVRIGQTLEFQVPALGHELFSGNIRFLAGQAAKANQSFAAELVTKNPDARLRSGFMVRVRLDLGRISSGVAVPIHAVLPQRGNHVVYVAQDGRAERRQLRILEFVNREAIVEGLQPGERLIVEGHRDLLDGQPVTADSPGDTAEDHPRGEP